MSVEDTIEQTIAEARISLSAQERASAQKKTAEQKKLAELREHASELINGLDSLQKRDGSSFEFSVGEQGDRLFISTNVPAHLDSDHDRRPLGDETAYIIASSDGTYGAYGFGPDNEASGVPLRPEERIVMKVARAATIKGLVK